MSFEDCKGVFKWWIDLYETRIIALAKPENIASNKVIQKLGLKFEHFVSGLPKEFDFYNGEPYYSLTKDEYLQKISR